MKQMSSTKQAEISHVENGSDMLSLTAGIISREDNVQLRDRGQDGEQM
jgi:hypothetical protein